MCYDYFVQKGFAGIIILVVVLILAGLGGAYYFRQSQVPKSQSQNQVTASQAPQPTSTPTSSSDETVYTEQSRSANWKTYTNLSLNYELKYPETWKIEEDRERIDIVPSGTKYPFNIGIKDLDQDRENMINDLITLNQNQNGTQIAKNSNLQIGKLETLKIKHSTGDLNAVDLFAFTNSQMITVSFLYQTKDEERLQIINQILSTFKFLP